MGEASDSISSRQLGLITRAQACARGLSADAVDRRIASGRWVTVHPGVYRVAGSPVTWEQQLLAACLWGGPEALVSHRAAGVLWKLDGVEGGRTVEVSTPRTRRLRSARIVAHSSRDLVPGDRTRVGRIPVTSLARTLIDLASELDAESLELAFEEAMRRSKLLVPWLASRLEYVNRGHRGVDRLRSLVEWRLTTPSLDESPLETRLRLFLDKHRCPRFEQQFKLQVSPRTLKIDFAWPELRYAVETDGRRAHDSSRQFAVDRRRWNDITVAGWTLVVVTWRDLHDRPQQTLFDVQRGMAVARARAALPPILWTSLPFDPARQSLILPSRPAAPWTCDLRNLTQGTLPLE